MLIELPASGAEKLGYLVRHLLIYACYGFVFFNVINVNVSSLRARLPEELLARHTAPLPDAELQARCSSREIVLTRLARLEVGGQIEALRGALLPA